MTDNLDKLSDIHDMLADHYLDILKDPKKRAGLCAADLSAISKFLKDNGIAVSPAAKTSKIKDIAKILPFPADDDVAATGT